MQKKTLTINVAGKELIFETGKVARQAAGSVLVHCGETTLLATACRSDKASEEIDFFPLRVDYIEKFSSVGKTLSGFIKREGRPTAHDILVSRFIDRTIRPLFPDGYYNEVQILASVYSYDGINKPDVLGICAASAALTISDIPFVKPIGAVRVGMIDGNFVINPSEEEQKKSTLDLVLAGSEDAILMIEGYCEFLTEDQVLDAIEMGHTSIKEICKGLSEWQKEIGKEKITDTIHVIPEDLFTSIREMAKEDLTKAFSIKEKKKREVEISLIKEKVLKKFHAEENPLYPIRDIQGAFKQISAGIMRNMVLDTQIRIDGRKLDEVRPIDIEPNYLARTHGSALFTRGETQSIAVCTLGGKSMAQRYEDLHGDSSHKFYLQYFFPPFSVGEVGRSGPPGRREIGHGKLAERAIAMTLPSQDDFPYVIRLESNITESNGSSSMASVCGGCLALMDAGVPISRPVSGIAMGLILEKDQSVILSDILGAEDALGDMDFKITGDEKGITAFQMDIKVEGITHEIMKKALLQAKEGRMHILMKMLEAQPKFNAELSKYAPRIESIMIKPSKIGELIGPGGKKIREIIEVSGAEIDINDDGIVSIVSTDQESLEKAKKMIENTIGEVEVGQVYEGTIVSIKDFGLFIRVLGQEGLCHISEISNSRINNLNDIFKIGDKLKVIVKEITNMGKVSLSHKALLNKESDNKEE